MRPSWDRLYEVAAGQAGYFTTHQAAEAGYSTHLLRKHILSGRIARPRRKIYRLVHFPAAEHEELVQAWLWSDSTGIVSHQTALALHGLSDVLPANVHLTLPETWRHRRFRLPPDVVLHHADLSNDERVWFGAVPTTTPQRTLNDCARASISPELLRQAAQQALRRGLATTAELTDVEEALKPFGGIAS